jgi:hypothetical protein
LGCREADENSLPRNFFFSWFRCGDAVVFHRGRNAQTRAAAANVSAKTGREYGRIKTTMTITIFAQKGEMSKTSTDWPERGRSQRRPLSFWLLQVYQNCV